MKAPILIVEDDPDGQLVLSHVVEYLNIPYQIAKDAETALQLLDTSDTVYQAIIIDLALPGKDGWDLLADIRRDVKTARYLCIAVTAFHANKTREEALNAGFDAYFAKPLNATNFAKQLDALL